MTQMAIYKVKHIRLQWHNCTFKIVLIVVRHPVSVFPPKGYVPYAPIGCDTQRAFMKWSRTSYDSKKEHSRTGENEKGIQNPQVWSLQKSISKQW